MQTSESAHAKNGGKESAIENLYNRYCSSGLLMCPGCRLEPWSTRFSQGRILHFFIHRTCAHFVCCNLSHAATLAYNRRVLDAAREIEQKLAPFQEAAESKFPSTKAPLTWFRSLLPLIIIFGASSIFFFWGWLVELHGGLDEWEMVAEIKF